MVHRRKTPRQGRGGRGRGLRIALGVVVAAVLALVGLELASGYLQYRGGGEQGLAVQWLYRTAKRHLLGWDWDHARDLRPAARRIASAGDARCAAAMAAHDRVYEALLGEIAATGAAPLLLHMPMQGDKPRCAAPDGGWPRHYGALAARAGIGYVDMAPAFAGVPPERLYLIPDDIHPTRYANLLVADALIEALSRIGPPGVSRLSAPPDAPLGPWDAGTVELRRPSRGHVFVAATDADGFRTTHPAAATAAPPPRTLLLIGDSFTFGSYLNAADTFAARLALRDRDLWVRNAGRPGAGPIREYRYFAERGRHVGAGIVVLQVNDGDFEDFLIESVMVDSGFLPADLRAAIAEVAAAMRDAR